MVFRHATARITFTRQEKLDLLLSWSLLSLAFAILFAGALSWTLEYLSQLLVMFIVAGITVGIGFVGHELAHKTLALRYGCVATFVANKTMLLFAVAFSFFGFVFAAPGAVWIRGTLSRRQHGLVALVGPLANLAIALLFLPLLSVFPLLARPGVTTNAFLAMFNLLPLPGLDGWSVMRWHKGYYALALIASILLTVAAFML